tara:strand:+ start:343 stop:444 length:102 start_codon:yes stop_codon:yes gene_type:complete
MKMAGLLTFPASNGLPTLYRVVAKVGVEAQKLF